jgi:UDP-N-acetylglucosamine:LPS N-acetylglucosamine transferase
MGIAVGQAAGIPSVLIENFTWDWIYQPYTKIAPRFAPHIEYLETLFNQADYHIQTEPVCRHQKADLLTLPVSRKPRISTDETRKRLKIADGVPFVLITMGGIPKHYTIHEKLKDQSNLWFVISGSGQALHREHNFVVLPHHSAFYHPDLVNAADVVIGKAGYSTFAEVFYAGVPFIFVKRPKFRESEILADYIHKHSEALAITEEEFETGMWIPQIKDLLERTPARRKVTTGAMQAADFVDCLLE